MGSKEMETTAHNTGNVGELVNNIPVIMLQPVTRPLGRMEPNDFHLVRALTKHLAGKRFTPDTDKKQAVISWLKNLGTNFFYYTTRTSLGAMLWQTLKYQWWLHEYLMCTTYCPCAMYTSRSKLSSWHQCLLTWFFITSLYGNNFSMPLTTKALKHTGS